MSQGDEPSRPQRDWSLPPLPPQGEGGEAEPVPPPASPERFVPAEPPPLPPWLRSEPVGQPAPPAAEPVPEPPPEPAGGANVAAAAEEAAPEVPPPPFSEGISASQAPAFGDTMALGVLLTFAGGSATAGGIFALQQSDQLSFTVKAIICGGIAVVLLAGALALRLVRGSDPLRGTLAVIGIAFAAAGLAFAYDPSGPTDHDNLVKFALDAGLVTVLGWFTAIAVPSAVAGLIAAVGLPVAAGAGVWLGITSPTHVQVYVTALGLGLALAVALPRVRAMRPHARGLGWALAGAAVVVALPAAELITRGDAVAMAAGSTASAALLLIAQRHRNLPAAIGALLGFAALESTLVTTYVGLNDSGPASSTRLLVIAIAGAVLVGLVAAVTLLTARGRARPRWSLPVSATELVLVAALALTLVALFTGPGDVPYNPPQLSSGSTATSAAP